MRRLYGVIALLLGTTALSIELSRGPILTGIAGIGYQNRAEMLLWFFTQYPVNIGTFIAIAMIVLGIILCLKKKDEV